MLVRRFSDGRYRKTNYRCIVEGLSSRTSWQVAKTYDQSTYIKRRVLYYTTDIIYILENTRQEILPKSGLLWTDSSKYQFCSLSQLTIWHQL